MRTPIFALALLLLAGTAQAAPVRLDATQMDGVTAGGFFDGLLGALTAPTGPSPPVGPKPPSPPKPPGKPKPPSPPKPPKPPSRP